MDLEDFPFDKFSKFKDIKLIKKVARYVGDRYKTEHVLSMYVKLGMIDAKVIKIYNNRADVGHRFSFQIIIESDDNEEVIYVKSQEHFITEVASIAGIIAMICLFYWFLS